MTELRKLIEKLCLCSAPSGDEGSLAKTILEEIAPYCTAKIDPNGNIIAFKQGKNKAASRVMLDAHLDEVGVMVTAVTEDGFLKFETLGGILAGALVCKTVQINGHVGVIGAKPIHLSSAEERQKPFSPEDLVIDIGAADRQAALAVVQPGDSGTFLGEYINFDEDMICTKALDDRIGCALLITLLKQPAEYDFYATFTVQEELGLRGAKTATYTVNPDVALVLESTTANDIANTDETKAVCYVGKGAVLSFMDRATLYDRGLFNLLKQTAESQKIAVQTKNAVAGGNNAGAVSLTRSGVRTAAISLPCRYIHSACSVASLKDAEQMLFLTKAVLPQLCTLKP